MPIHFNTNYANLKIPKPIPCIIYTKQTETATHAPLLFMFLVPVHGWYTTHFRPCRFQAVTYAPHTIQNMLLVRFPSLDDIGYFTFQTCKFQVDVEYTLIWDLKPWIIVDGFFDESLASFRIQKVLYRDRLFSIHLQFGVKYGARKLLYEWVLQGHWHWRFS